MIFSLNILTWYIYKPVYIRLMPSNGRLISSIISVALEAQSSVFLRCFSEVDLIFEDRPYIATGGCCTHIPTEHLFQALARSEWQSPYIHQCSIKIEARFVPKVNLDPGSSMMDLTMLFP